MAKFIIIFKIKKSYNIFQEKLGQTMKNFFSLSLLIICSFFISGCNSSKVQSEVQNNDSNINTNLQTERSDTMENSNIKKTNSGLEYKVLKPGTGQSPEKGDIVTVHYTGWLNENGEPGKKFDSSVDRGEPFKFIIGIGQVIKGWDEGVSSMQIGEKCRLFIPSELGYGAHGAGNVIPPNSDLIFDVELLDISKR